MSNHDSDGSDAALHGENDNRWNELKRARNRINSQKTREREREQMDMLENDKARLWLSNDCLKYQNNHLKEAIRLIREHKNDPLRSQPAPPRILSSPDAKSLTPTPSAAPGRVSLASPANCKVLQGIPKPTTGVQELGALECAQIHSDSLAGLLLANDATRRGSAVYSQQSPAVNSITLGQLGGLRPIVDSSSSIQSILFGKPTVPLSSAAARLGAELSLIRSAALASGATTRQPLQGAFAGQVRANVVGGSLENLKRDWLCQRTIHDIEIPAKRTKLF